MMKRYFLAALLLFGTSLTALADEGKLSVLYLDGQNHEVVLSKVEKLQVSGGDIKLVGRDGATVATHKLADVERIDLTASTPTGIGTVKNQGTITIRSNGYTITAEGMTDGQTLEVFTAQGKLAGKAVAHNGKATFHAASLAAGTYVVKAEGQSLKMVKK